MINENYKKAIEESAYINPVVKIAKEAGEILIEGKKKIASLSTSTKSSNPNDILTEYDLIVEEFIVTKLRDHFPDIPIIGEEGTSSENVDIKQGLVWIVDPIDGTLNFRMNRKDFSISIGLFEDGKPLFGVIHAPARNEMYVAERGRGAFLNEEQIFVREKPLTQVPLYHFELHKIDYQKIIRDISPLAAHIRRFGGSAALDLALVAAGQVDAQFSTSLNLWDVAAGFIIVLEAGGICLSPSGDELSHSLEENSCSYVVGHQNQVENLIDQLPGVVVSGIPFGKTIS